MNWEDKIDIYMKSGKPITLFPNKRFPYQIMEKNLIIIEDFLSSRECGKTQLRNNLVDTFFKEDLINRKLFPDWLDEIGIKHNYHILRSKVRKQ